MDINGFILIILVILIAILIVSNGVGLLVAGRQYKNRKVCSSSGSKNDALSSSINLQRNNFLNDQENLNHTPVQISTGKTEFDVITNFQKLVEYEICDYFVPKIKEGHNYINQKDWLMLSVKWNTIETLFNIDNIHDYIKEHIKNPEAKADNRQASEAFKETLALSKFSDIPTIIEDIRNQLSENEDFIQEIIGTLHASNGGEEESNQEEQQTYRSLNNTDIVNLKTDPVLNKNEMESNINIFDGDDQNDEENQTCNNMERSLPNIDLVRK